MMISRRQFIRQILILTIGFVLEIFGFKPKKAELSKEDQKSNFYKFELSESQLKIRPGESFNAKIHWPSKQQMASVRGPKIILDGIYWQELT